MLEELPEEMLEELLLEELLLEELLLEEMLLEEMLLEELLPVLLLLPHKTCKSPHWGLLVRRQMYNRHTRSRAHTPYKHNICAFCGGQVRHLAFHITPPHNMALLAVLLPVLLLLPPKTCKSHHWGLLVHCRLYDRHTRPRAHTQNKLDICAICGGQVRRAFHITPPHNVALQLLHSTDSLPDRR